MAQEHPNPDRLDVLLIGGGIAGLWLANLLHRRGYATVLLEADQLGGRQTLASQGMIHGGLKYALGGSLTGASEAIAGMPARWRDCLAGRGEIDLTGLAPLSEHYYLFAEGNSLGKLTSFFASRLLRGRIDRLEPENFPEGLRRFDGVVYALNDFVLNTPELLQRLLEPIADRVFRHRLDAAALTRIESGWQIRIDDRVLHANKLILCAGAGTGAILESLGVTEPALQIRPLHQVVVRHPALSPLYAHCLTGITRSEPRLTITSHPDKQADAGSADASPDARQWLWYLGGQLATGGVERDSAAQIEHARRELQICVPWLVLDDAEFQCLKLDRAEPRQSGGRRPDQAFVADTDGLIVCWPTKLSLAPDLGDRVLQTLDPPTVGVEVALPTLNLAAADLGALPWEC